MKKDGKLLTVELIAVLFISLLVLVMYPIVKMTIEKNNKEKFIKEINEIVESVESNNKTEAILKTFKANELNKTSESKYVTDGSLYFLNGKVQLFLYGDDWCAVKRYEDSSILVSKYDGECYIDKAVIIAGKSVVLVDSGDGLYETSDEYTYRGPNPNNFVALKINDENILYRIIDVNKKGEIKLIRNDILEERVWGTNESYSVIKDGNIGYYLNTSDIANQELLDLRSMSFITETNIFLEDVDSISQGIEKTENIISTKVGLLNVSDYLNASTDNICKIKNSFINCQKNNWLNNETNYWTLTEVDQEKQEAYIINNKGNIFASSQIEAAGIRPVVYLSQSVTFIGTGTKDLPYKIKK